MAQRIRSFDWETTPLGSSGAWPPSLRTAVELMLASPVLATLAVGPDRVFLYNDEAVRHYGRRHPEVLGQPLGEAFAHEFHAVAPFYDRVFLGESLRVPAQPLDPARSGVAEVFEAYLTPLLDGDRVIAAVMTGFAIGARMKADAALRESEAHSAFLIRFSDEVRGLSDPRVIAEAACRLVAERLRTERAYWAEVDWAEREYVIGAAFHLPGIPVIEGRFPLDAWEPLTSLHLNGRAVVVNDARTDPRIPPALREGYARLAVGADLAAPVMVNGRLRCALAVSGGGARDWTPEEVALVQGIAGRCWAEVERARAEAALRKSEARFRGFAEASADVLWIADARAERLDYISPAFDRVYGVPRGEAMAGASFVSQLVHPQDRETFFSLGPRAIAGEAAVGYYRVIRPDGSVLPVRDTAFAIRDEGGGILHIAGIVQDISDIEAMQSALTAEKERFRTLAEGIPPLVWRSDEEGRWTWSSPQWREHTGQTRAESLGLGWLRAIHPDDRKAVMAAWHAARSRGRLEAECRVYLARDGSWRWHQVRSLPVRNGATAEEPERRILEWVGTTTDIDGLKRLQAEQGILLAELQHRTRNLLAVVKSVARKSIPPQPGRDEYDARLSALSRVQGFLAQTGAYAVPLRDLVEAELQAAGEGTSGRVTVGGPAIDLPGEGAQPVALALHELVTNAVKYGALARTGGCLSVTWTVEDRSGERRLLIVWRESGVTMPSGLPERRGYGSELITRALPYQMRAETVMAFTPDGLLCSISLPRSAFQEKDADS